MGQRGWCLYDGVEKAPCPWLVDEGVELLGAVVVAGGVESSPVHMPNQMSTSVVCSYKEWCIAGTWEGVQGTCLPWLQQLQHLGGTGQDMRSWALGQPL